jgi:transposase
MLAKSLSLTNFSESAFEKCRVSWQGRTFAWLGRHRRLKADYECLPETTEALIQIAMIRLMVRRLAPQ